MNSDFKIAVVSTIYYPASHADVIVTRWLEPREGDKEWGWDAPKTRITSFYVQQFPALDARDLPAEEFERDKYRTDVDLARWMSEKHDVPLYPTVREALTLGGDSLAVDAVLLIGEHGEYPFNELRQKLYPRKELFDEIIAVFRESKQVVPLFCDKHLSWNSDWAKEMFETTQRMQIPFFAGSSLPLVGLDPPAPDLTGMKLIEYVSLFYVGPEAYGFHSLELMQSLIEKRHGGETGIRSITAYVGDEVELAMSEGVWSRDLFEAAMRSTVAKKEGDWRENCKGVATYEGTSSPSAVVFEHADGLRSAHIVLEGHLQDFTVAMRLEDGTVLAGRSAIGGADSFHGHFATLDANIERFFLTGKPPFPPIRNLLTTLAIATSMKALHTPGKPLETPELLLSY